MRFMLLPAIAAILAAVVWPGFAWAADAERGRSLYESRCGGCHAQSVHGREKRVATDFASVRTWVRRWSANLGLKWSEDDVEAVAVHLNASYYRFSCPPPACKATGQRGGSRTSVAAR
jgi:mono/diheme cytochrome c family protein